MTESRNRIVKKIPDEKVLAAKKLAAERKLNKLKGVLMGMAVGDALGRPFEFRDFRYPPPFRFTRLDMEDGWAGSEPYKAGLWTDDASQGACLIDAFIKMRQNEIETGKRKFPSGYFMEKIYQWNKKGLYSGLDLSFPFASIGLGGVVSQGMESWGFQKSLYPKSFVNGKYPAPAEALVEYRKTHVDKNGVLLAAGLCDGNGSTMRNGACAVFAQNEQEAMDLADKQSKTTTPGNESSACSQLLAFLTYQAINSEDEPSTCKERILSPENLKKFLELLGKDDPAYGIIASLCNGKDNKEKPWLNWRVDKDHYQWDRKAKLDYYGSYATQGLAFVLHVIHTTDSLEEALTIIARSYGDSDSNCAVAAQLLGAIYGFDAIPKRWVDAVNQYPLSPKVDSLDIETYGSLTEKALQYAAPQEYEIIHKQEQKKLEERLKPLIKKFDIQSISMDEWVEEAKAFICNEFFDSNGKIKPEACVAFNFGKYLPSKIDDEIITITGFAKIVEYISDRFIMPSLKRYIDDDAYLEEYSKKINNAFNRDQISSLYVIAQQQNYKKSKKDSLQKKDILKDSLLDDEEAISSERKPSIEIQVNIQINIQNEKINNLIFRALELNRRETFFNPRINTLQEIMIEENRLRGKVLSDSMRQFDLKRHELIQKINNWNLGLSKELHKEFIDLIANLPPESSNANYENIKVFILANIHSSSDFLIDESYINGIFSLLVELHQMGHMISSQNEKIANSQRTISEAYVGKNNYNILLESLQTRFDDHDDNLNVTRIDKNGQPIFDMENIDRLEKISTAIKAATGNNGKIDRDKFVAKLSSIPLKQKVEIKPEYIVKPLSEINNGGLKGVEKIKNRNPKQLLQKATKTQPESLDLNLLVEDIKRVFISLTNLGNEKIVKQIYNKVKENTDNPEQFLSELTELCRKHLASSSRTKNSKVALLCQAIAEYDDNVAFSEHSDTKISTLDELVITQQKRSILSNQLRNKFTHNTFEKYKNSSVNISLNELLKNIKVNDPLLNKIRDELVDMDPRTILNFNQDTTYFYRNKNKLKRAAFVDVDATLVSDRDGVLNKSLITALQNASITDIYLTTDMTAKTLNDEKDSAFINRIQIKQYLERLGFKVTIVTTSDASMHQEPGYTFKHMFEPYYLKGAKNLKVNMDQYAELNNTYQSYVLPMMDLPQIVESFSKKDECYSDDDKTRMVDRFFYDIKEIKDMLSLINESLEKGLAPQYYNDYLGDYLKSYLKMDKIEENKFFAWKPFSKYLAHHIMILETDAHKLLAEHYANKKRYADTKGALYEYLISKLPPDTESVVVVDDKMSCLNSANQAKKTSKYPIPFSTLQVMNGTYLLLCSSTKGKIPTIEDFKNGKEPYQIQNQEVRIYPYDDGQLVAYWCQDGKIIRKFINNNILNEYPEIKSRFEGNMADMSIRANDKNDTHQKFFEEILGSQYLNIPSHDRNHFDSNNQSFTQSTYHSNLLTPDYLLQYELIKLSERYAAKKTTHKEDFNHLINDVKFILQQSDDHERNTRQILEKIDDYFAREERNFHKPLVGLFAKNESIASFKNFIKGNTSEYQFPKMLLGLLEKYHPKYKTAAREVVDQGNNQNLFLK